jgi:hypothetical protein
MTKLSLAILGTAAILTSALAGPAMAKGAMAKGAKGEQVTHAKSQSHMQRRAAYRGERFRDANAVVTRDQYSGPAGPVGAAGAVVGGAVATAGAIATAPFRAFDSGYNSYDNSYNNYYGYGYGGRDWKTYAARNNLVCTPGTTFRGADGQQRLCQ